MVEMLHHYSRMGSCGQAGVRRSEWCRGMRLWRRAARRSWYKRSSQEQDPPPAQGAGAPSCEGPGASPVSVRGHPRQDEVNGCGPLGGRDSETGPLGGPPGSLDSEDRGRRLGRRECHFHARHETFVSCLLRPKRRGATLLAGGVERRTSPREGDREVPIAPDRLRYGPFGSRGSPHAAPASSPAHSVRPARAAHGRVGHRAVDSSALSPGSAP